MLRTTRARPSALWLLASAALVGCSTPPTVNSTQRPLFVATWPFGKQATERALASVREGGSLLDGVEQGIRLIESLSSDGSVGLEGRPNAAGYTQLDASIMNGPDHGAGSVAAMEGVVYPISVARAVMEHSPHVMLVGEGARWFALEHGVEAIDIEKHAALKAAWLAREVERDTGERGHDTITVLALDADGNLCGGSSTSGSGGKYPGRVGDSPILGAGLYVDNEVGAAGATGLGENIMRHCASVMIVERMRQGLHPRAACEEVIHYIAAHDPLGYELSMHFIAIDKSGRHGAASSSGHFPFAVTSPDSSRVEKVAPVERRR